MVDFQYSIIIPIYNNEEFIPELLACCVSLKENLGKPSEFIFVVDGSPDNSLAKLKASLPNAKINSKLVELSRNFGSFSAIRTGLQYAKGKYLFFMAADLQEPPSFILDSAKILENGEFDIVIGKRKDRNDGFLNDLSSNTFWNLYRKIIPNVPKGGVDIFACTQQVKDSLLQLNESNTSLIGQLYWIGFKKLDLEYSRTQRKHGVSGWTFKKKLKYLMDSVFNFTDYPLRLLLSLGFIGCALSILLGIILIYLRITEVIQVPGYVAILITIMFFGSLNLAAVGIIGEYLHRTFDNTKNRSQSIVRNIQFFGNN
jgi:polyisoprenyl-phosphate glycosyltransferase